MGGGRLWGVLALLTLGAAMLATIREVVELRPDVEDMWAVAQGEQPTPTFALDLRPDGKVLVYTGGINEGPAEALGRQIAAAPQLTTLEIDSPGGWLREGKRIAEVIRRHQLDTHVARECFSSCTLVLLAGRQRSAERGAEVGFHRGRGIGQTRRPRTAPRRGGPALPRRRARPGVRRPHPGDAERLDLGPDAARAARRGCADALRPAGLMHRGTAIRTGTAGAP